MSFTGQSLYSENLYGVETTPKQLTEAAETYLLQQHFPGNVRELRNMIERAITLSEDTTIDVSHLHPAPLRANISNPFASVAQSIQTTVAAPQVVKNYQVKA